MSLGHFNIQLLLLQRERERCACASFLCQFFCICFTDFSVCGRCVRQTREVKMVTRVSSDLIKSACMSSDAGISNCISQFILTFYKQETVKLIDLFCVFGTHLNKSYLNTTSNQHLKMSICLCAIAVNSLQLCYWHHCCVAD